MKLNLCLQLNERKRESAMERNVAREGENEQREREREREREEQSHVSIAICGYSNCYTLSPMMN